MTSNIARFVGHVTNYSLISVLVTIAGLISFPVLTRLLSVDDYGLLSLIALLLGLIVAVGKLGLQHAVLRFYGEVRAGKRDDMPTFVATMLIGMGAVGIVATVLWALFAQWMPRSWWSDPRIPSLLLLTSSLVLVRVLESAWVNQLRAQERSTTLAKYSVMKRYFVLAATLITLFWLSRSLWGLYVAMIVTEALALIALGVVMLRTDPWLPARFSPQLFRAMLAFGVPMIGTELSSILLSMGDRYVIQLYLGVELLGAYAAAYNLCDYIKGALLISLTAAALPMAVRSFENHGVEETRRFLHTNFHVYFLVAFPAVAGIAAVGEELLAVLATPRYRAGAPVMPVIMAALAFEAFFVLASASLYLMKRSRTTLLLIAASAVISLGLNFVLVPRLGLQGAAFSLLAGWVLLAAASLLLGTRYLALSIPWSAALKFCLLALLMYAVIHPIVLANDIATLLVRMMLGAAIYISGALLLDGSTRAHAREAMARFAARRTPA